MAIQNLLNLISDTPWGVAMRESAFLFPTVECMHVVAITFVAGTIFMVDLRLLGVTARHQAVTRMTHEVLPWTWGAFVLAVITGSLLFSSNALKYYENEPFRFKALCMVLAGVNMVVFHLVTQKSVKTWDRDVGTPPAAKIAGVLSLAFWILVVGFARWTGFTIGS